MEPDCHNYPVAMQIGVIRNHVAEVDSDAETDAAIGGPACFMGGNFALHVDSTLNSL